MNNCEELISHCNDGSVKVWDIPNKGMKVQMGAFVEKNSNCFSVSSNESFVIILDMENRL